MWGELFEVVIEFEFEKFEFKVYVVIFLLIWVVDLLFNWFILCCIVMCVVVEIEGIFGM